MLKIVLILICAIMLLEQKIPYIVVPQGLPLSGDITLVWYPNIVVSGSYTISEDVVTMSGWSKFVNRNAFLKIEDTVLLFLNIGTSGGLIGTINASENELRLSRFHRHWKALGELS